MRQTVACVTLFFCALVSLAAVADPNRTFNDKVLRGDILFQQPPVVVIDGAEARLAPGARIRGEDNLQKLSATLAGRRAVVNYTLDLNGQLLDVWLLTAQERARKPWPSTAAQARAWSFDVNAQTWTKP